jgi:hypothetical protein
MVKSIHGSELHPGIPMGGINLWGTWGAVTARGSRAHFFSAGGGLNIKSEIKEIKRADKAEPLQDVGPEGMAGLHVWRRFSANYFQTGSCAACRPSAWGGGLNLHALSGPGPHGSCAHLCASFGKLFLATSQGARAGQSRAGACVQKTPRNSGWGGVVMEWLYEGMR